MSDVVRNTSPSRAKPIGRPELQHLHWRFLAIEAQHGDTSTESSRKSDTKATRRPTVENTKDVKPSCGLHSSSSTVKFNHVPQADLDVVSDALATRLHFHASKDDGTKQRSKALEAEVVRQMKPTDFSFSALHAAGKSLRQTNASGVRVGSDPLDALAPRVSSLAPQPSGGWTESVSSTEAIAMTSSTDGRSSILKPRPITYVSIIASLVKDGDELLKRDLRGTTSTSVPAYAASPSLSQIPLELTDIERRKRIKDVYEERQRRRRKRLSRIGALEAGVQEDESLQLESLNAGIGPSPRPFAAKKPEEEEDLVTYLQKTWLKAMRAESCVPLVGGSDADATNGSTTGSHQRARRTKQQHSGFDNSLVDSDDEELFGSADDGAGDNRERLDGADARGSNASHRPKQKRPASPVVLWKSSSRIQLATHVPTALRALLIQNAITQTQRAETAHSQSSSFPQVSGLEPSEEKLTIVDDNIEPPAFAPTTQSIGRGGSDISRSKSESANLPALTLPHHSTSASAARQSRGTARGHGSARNQTKPSCLSLNDPKYLSELVEEETRLTSRRRANARRFGAWYFPPELWTARATAQQTLEGIDTAAANLRPDISGVATTPELSSTSVVSNHGDQPLTSRKPNHGSEPITARAQLKGSGKPQKSLESDTNVLTLLGGCAGDSEALEEVLCHLAARELEVATKGLLKGSTSQSNAAARYGGSTSRANQNPSLISSFDILAQAQTRFKTQADRITGSSHAAQINLPVEAERALAIKLREYHPRTLTRAHAKSCRNIEAVEDVHLAKPEGAAALPIGNSSDSTAMRDALTQRRLGDTIRSLPIAKEFVKFLLSGGVDEDKSSTQTHDSIGGARALRLPAYLRGIAIDDTTSSHYDPKE